MYIPTPGGGRRPLGIPTVRDRIVQQAALEILGPIFEGKFSGASHGFRPGRGCQTALDVIDKALRAGYEWAVDADIEKFFDTVDHELLLDAVHEEVSDGSVLRLLRMFLASGALIGPGDFEPTEVGTPQGGPISPLLANIYLHRFDEAMKAGKFGLVRYADDFVILTKNRERAEEALELAGEVLLGLKLDLHPEKTRIAAIDEGFDFLGYRYVRDKRGKLRKVVSRKAILRFREAIRKRTRRHAGQKRRKVKHCTLLRLRRSQSIRRMVEELDGFVRRRLRCHIAGRYAKGRWQQILGDELFHALGLFPLATHGPDLCQPLWPAPHSWRLRSAQFGLSRREPDAVVPHVRFERSGRPEMPALTQYRRSPP